MSNLKIFIHGFGNIGKKHYDIFKKLGYKEIECFSSKTKNIKEIIIKNYNEKKFQTASIICTPSNLHLSDALFYARNKINIFIEKPISNNLNNRKDLFSLKRLVIKNNLTFQVGYCLKFLESYKILERKIGKIISNEKVLRINLESLSNLNNWGKKKKKLRHPATLKKYGGGVLLELSHDIDILRSLFGEIKYVYCSNSQSKTFDTDVEDTSNFIVDFENNSQATATLSFSSPKTSRFIEIVTDKNIIKWDILRGNILINNKYFYKSEVKHFQQMYKNQFNYFVKHLKKQAKVDYKHSLDSSIRTLEVIQSLKKSNDLKKRVRVSN